MQSFMIENTFSETIKHAFVITGFKLNMVVSTDTKSTNPKFTSQLIDEKASTAPLLSILAKAGWFNYELHNAKRDLRELITRPCRLYFAGAQLIEDNVIRWLLNLYLCPIHKCNTRCLKFYNALCTMPRSILHSTKHKAGVTKFIPALLAFIFK